jgi:hypothetical protein
VTIFEKVIVSDYFLQLPDLLRGKLFMNPSFISQKESNVISSSVEKMLCEEARCY